MISAGAGLSGWALLGLDQWGAVLIKIACAHPIRKSGDKQALGA